VTIRLSVDEALEAIRVLRSAVKSGELYSDALDEAAQRGVSALESLEEQYGIQSRELEIAGAAFRDMGTVAGRHEARVRELEEQYEYVSRERKECAIAYSLATKERAELKEQYEVVTRERDEARSTADGMARAPYGEFEKMREQRDGFREQYESLRSSIRFCPNCAHGYEWQESDPAEGLCPGCRRAFRIEEETHGLKEQLEDALAALQHHGYGPGLCRCEECSALGDEYVDRLTSNPAREPQS